MRNSWKKITRAKWFPAAAIAIAFCMALAIFNGVTGQKTIVSRAVGAIMLPGQRAVTYAALSVADTYNRFFQYDELIAEKEALQQQVTDLTAQLEDAQAAAEENASLREMLGVQERGTSFEYAAAEVVARSMDEWTSVLSIDAGTEDGLELYDSVVTSKGMVGYITEISAHSAQVTTILDSNLSAGARIVRTGELAVAGGDYQLMSDGKLKLSYIDKGADVVVGDTVQTSGSSSLFPKGLVIGTVESVQTESNGMSNYAVLVPADNVNTLTHVYIITETMLHSE